MLLNLVLAALVFFGVVFALLGIWRTRDLRTIAPQAQQANMKMVMIQSLANDVAGYNAQAKSPELTRALQSLQAKPATH